MIDHEGDDQTAEERGALEGLRVSQDPPEDLERRILTTLRERGAFTRPPRRTPLILATATALALTFLAGFTAGRRASPLASASTPGGGGEGASQYVLMFISGPREPAADANSDQWTAGLRREGRLVLDRDLDERVSLVTADPSFAQSMGTEMGSMLVIAARDRADAEAVARASPYVQRGGTIAVHEAFVPPPGSR